MRPPRIVNRGRIAPSSPQPVVDSGRNSFSSASAVSTIDDIDPEPETNVPQAASKKLQKSIQGSSIRNELIIGLGIAAPILIVFGIIVGIAYPLIMAKTTSTTTTTTTTTTSTMIATNGTQIKI